MATPQLAERLCYSAILGIGSRVTPVAPMRVAGL